METINVDVMQVVDVSDIPKVSMKEIVLIKPKGMSLVKQIAAMQVKDTASLDAMNIGLRKINKVIKFIEETCLAATKPLRDATKQVNNQVKVKLAPIQECFKEGKGRVMEYRAAEQQKIDEENAKIAEQNRLAEEKRLKEMERRQNISKAQGGDGSNIQEVPEVEPVREAQPLSVTDSTSVFRKLTVEVVAVNLVPPEYLENEKVKDAVRQAVTAKVQAWINKKGGIKNVKEEELPAILGMELSIEERTKH